MRTNNRIFAAAMAAIFIGGATLAPVAARASEEGRRNTALGLGALTAYLFTRGGSKVPAFLGLAGTAYAYKRYQDSINARHRWERAAYYYHHSYPYRSYSYRSYSYRHHSYRHHYTRHYRHHHYRW